MFPVRSYGKLKLKLLKKEGNHYDIDLQNRYMTLGQGHTLRAVT